MSVKYPLISSVTRERGMLTSPLGGGIDGSLLNGLDEELVVPADDGIGAAEDE